MNIELLMLLLALGAFVGVMAGLLGIGGGLIVVRRYSIYCLGREYPLS